jgi:hypothetical protein
MKFNGLHTICIRSSYQDPQMSRYRLELSRHTMVPSLRQQTCRQFQIYLRIHDNDPNFTERWDMWSSIGVPIVRTMDIDHGDGLNLQTRVDDDDAVSRDFVRDLQLIAAQQRRPRWIVQPQGMLFSDGRWFKMHHTSNMFGSVLVPGAIQIFQQTHGNLGKIARQLLVPANKRYWCWIRHAGTASVASTWRAQQPRATRREIQRFSHVSFPAVARLHDRLKTAGERHEAGVSDTEISGR